MLGPVIGVILRFVAHAVILAAAWRGSFPRLQSGPTSRRVPCPVPTYPVPIAAPSRFHVPIPARSVPCNSVPSRFVSRPAALPDDRLTGLCTGQIRRDFLGETMSPVPVPPSLSPSPRFGRGAACDELRRVGGEGPSRPARVSHPNVPGNWGNYSAGSIPG
jgi:hypothetical protein